jgi:hypothetical protein
MMPLKYHKLTHNRHDMRKACIRSPVHRARILPSAGSRRGRARRASLPFHPSKATGLERLEEASGKRDPHVRPRRKRGAVDRGRSADTKSSRPRGPRLRSRCPLYAPRCPISAAPRLHDRPADPVARVLPSARPLLSHGDPPLAQRERGNGGGQSSHAAAGLVRFAHDGCTASPASSNQRRSCATTSSSGSRERPNAGQWPLRCVTFFRRLMCTEHVPSKPDTPYDIS